MLLRSAGLLLFVALSAPLTDAQTPLAPVVEVEDEVYRFEGADNGAGPMWCSGSTCLVRVQDRVFASGLETLPQFPPLNNCRWQLFERAETGWQLRRSDAVGRTREPSPLAGFADGTLWLSANPTLTDPPQTAGPAQPQMLRWKAADTTVAPETILPVWDGAPEFSEHSYRSLAADGSRGELILLQNVGYTHAEWAFRDAQGQWPAQGKLEWPWGAEYDQPQPIRVCYPNVMLRNRAVYFCGVSDIVEPYARWRAAKKELTGREWDYDFRRLFFTWTDDITSKKFEKWVEIASRDKTCGWIGPCDLHVADDGRVHVLWTERAIDPRLRAKFFPDVRQSHALNYAILARGQVVHQQTLVLAEEGGANEIVGAARFHVAPSNRLFVIFHVSGTDPQGQPVSENRLLELNSNGTVGASVRVPLQSPLAAFFTATVRGGSPPSQVLDLLGLRAGLGNAICYARIRLW
ncbi:MAG: hypothetical protein ACYC3X_19890 [Pirellulaceae bacterium]